jgi:hypothetical protein
MVADVHEVDEILWYKSSHYFVGKTVYFLIARMTNLR